MYNQLGLRDNTVQPVHHEARIRVVATCNSPLSLSLASSFSSLGRFPREMDDVCTCEHRRAREERDGSYRFVINSRVCDRARPLSPRDLHFLSLSRQSSERIFRIFLSPRIVDDRFRTTGLAFVEIRDEIFVCFHFFYFSFSLFFQRLLMERDGISFASPELNFRRINRISLVNFYRTNEKSPAKGRI